ncbi:MAG: FtsH-binding integral membrane protein [Polaribacter sp.]|jgi:FtsH-binding integral membrane protein
MSYDTKILLIILLIVTLMFGGASLYAYFKMDDSNSEDVL